MTFYDEIKKHDWKTTTDQTYAKSIVDVERALSKDILNIEDFKALISPAAEGYLEAMAQKSLQKTQKRFGKTIQMYIPIYLTNYCTNSCIYCGFNHNNKLTRKALTIDEVRKESEIIKQEGFEHILLVTGEDNKNYGVDYIGSMIEELRKEFALVSIEVQPLDTDDYKILVEKGLNTVYVYQETYNEANYKTYHPKGKKSNYQYRLETPDRIGSAGVHKIGLGCLLGLEEWRTDSFFTALHLQYLEKHYWKSKYSISFPRLRPHSGAFEPNSIVTQKHLVQLICAYRLFNEHVEISLSTRESAAFRDNMLKLGVTSYSAGSKTNPGGYAAEPESLEQFSVNDDRTPKEIVAMIKNAGYEAVWKDWDYYMQR